MTNPSSLPRPIRQPTFSPAPEFVPEPALLSRSNRIHTEPVSRPTRHATIQEEDDEPTIVRKINRALHDEARQIVPIARRTTHNATPPRPQSSRSTQSPLPSVASPGAGPNRSRTFNAQFAAMRSAAYQATRGHTYGKATVSGKGRMIRGNSYGHGVNPLEMKSHVYGEIITRDDGFSYDGDLPAVITNAFMRGDISNEDLEHLGDTPEDYFDDEGVEYAEEPDEYIDLRR